MASLKSFCEILAQYSSRRGEAPLTMYDRQRALTRVGLLPEPQRGKGKGLEATPRSVAVMMIGMLACDSVVDTDHRVWVLARAEQPGLRCKVTKAVHLEDALTAILEKPSLAARVMKISVARESMTSHIVWHGRGGTTSFGSRSEFPTSLEVEAVFYGNVIEAIQSALLGEISDV